MSIWRAAFNALIYLFRFRSADAESMEYKAEVARQSGLYVSK